MSRKKGPLAKRRPARAKHHAPIAPRLTETTAMLMIGDGTLGLVMPAQHMAVWKKGPRTWTRMIEAFEHHPVITRCIGAAEIAAGLWLASCAAGRLNGKAA